MRDERTPKGVCGEATKLEQSIKAYPKLDCATMQKMVPCKGADEVLLILNNSVTVLTQNWEPCQADHAA